MALSGVAPETPEKHDEVVTRAVFLDRDGVLNANVMRDGKPVAPTMISDFQLLPGVGEAVRALKAAGFLAIVVTNQPDVRTGRTPKATLDAMHAALRSQVPVDDIKMCLHVEADGCECRKPKPGMLMEATHEHGIDLAASYLVGDRWRDIGAGKAAGCLTIFVDQGYEQETKIQPDYIVDSLPAAVAYILERERNRGRP